MAGYPRVIGYAPGTGIYGGYVAGADPGAPMLAAMQHGALPVQAVHPPMIHSPPWRPMLAPGSPPLGEGHVPIPMNPETFNGTWGNTAGGGAPVGTTIIFSARPQKPFKTARIIISPTKLGATAVGRLIGQIYVGTDLQQGELGNIDLESIGAATAFDTWLSLKQAEPGVWIRVQATLTAFPTGTDFEVYTVSALGHYLH
jgi:hypothetical protein